jgi:peroxiredoxin Q/BCP
MSELHGLQTRIDDIRAAGGEVLAISVDPPDKSAEIAEAYGLSYSVLSDPDLKVIDAYGVRHPDGGIEGHVARPATFIIDSTGRVAWYELADNWRVRPRPEEIVARLSEVR